MGLRKINMRSRSEKFDFLFTRFSQTKINFSKTEKLHNYENANKMSIF
jgi:hypothetical protein